MNGYCDWCKNKGCWTVTAAYLDNDQPVHRLFAIYPEPMYTTCDQHLAESLSVDISHPNSAGSWLIQPYMGT